MADTHPAALFAGADLANPGPAAHILELDAATENLTTDDLRGNLLVGDPEPLLPARSGVGIAHHGRRPLHNPVGHRVMARDHAPEGPGTEAHGQRRLQRECAGRARAADDAGPRALSVAELDV